MPKVEKKGLLSSLDIREIALCRRGMHPMADVVLYKRKDDAPSVASVKKEEMEEPRTFADHFESSRLMEIDEALDRRLYALLHTTTAIMRADVADREARILAAVEAYAETMQREVPELFAGRLAKWLNEFAAESRPEEEDVHAVVKTELGLAGLLPEAPSGGKEMPEFLKSLSERGQAALAYILGDRDPAEFFKGVAEDVGSLVIGLVEKAAEHGPAVAKLEADLAKASKPAADPNDLDSILKSVEDPGVRAYIETQAAAVKSLGGRVTDLQKAAKTKELEDVAKSLDCLPNEDGALVVILGKASDGGFLDDLKKILAAANEQAKIGKALEEIGISTDIGEGSVGTPEEAYEALVAKATEIRKGTTLSPEQAFEKACEEEPLLYAATRRTPASPPN